ncbi:hypothetical protein HNR77_004232 [Paenibacillus sp. JGP012]|nr:hypothetical protein [Paenibacillus sp. JGP012]MBB6023132.1 hypothetical protein [Paenibacillus sp. JGP012]
MKNQNDENRVVETSGYQPRTGIEERGIQPKASGKSLSTPKGGSSVKKP